MQRVSLSLLSVTLLLAACSATNIVSQPVLNPQGQPIGSAEATFHTDGTSDAQDVVIILSDGEHFQGKVIAHSTTSQRDVLSTRHYSKHEKKERREQGLDTKPREEWTTETYKDYSSVAEGMLIGTRGHSMRCQFTLTDPEWGMAWDGGVGECVVSDGRRIPIVAQETKADILR